MISDEQRAQFNDAFDSLGQVIKADAAVRGEELTPEEIRREQNAVFLYLFVSGMEKRFFSGGF